jgi:hypothetical protein
LHPDPLQTEIAEGRGPVGPRPFVTVGCVYG